MSERDLEVEDAARLRSAVKARNIRISELSVKDLDLGFLEALDNLIPGTSKLDKQQAAKILSEINSNPLHKIFVAKAETALKVEGINHLTSFTIAGTTALLVEPKFIFCGGRVGHIEDVSVRKGFEKLGIGARLVSHAMRAAERAGCVKIVLDCSDTTMPFYEKLGFSYQDNCMKKMLSSSFQTHPDRRG